MINNSIYRNGREVGFRCSRCGDIVTKMWGTICNDCRDKSSRHKELVDEIKSLKKEVKKLKIK